LSLEENTNVVYLMSSSYDPNFEYTMNPFDKILNIAWQPVDYKQSERDLNAKDLPYFTAENLLPIYAER
jgi:dTDP-4-dehydrorhamnose 3,5-epimerase-like enzyme